MTAPTPGPVRRETDLSIAASVAAGLLGPMDVGAIAALRAYADQIDWATAADAALIANGDTPKHMEKAAFGTLPSFIKACESCGLTPNSRLKLATKPKTNGKIGQLRAVRPTIKTP